MEHEEFLQKMLWNIDDANFAVRLSGWFREIGIFKIADLVRHTDEDLLKKLPLKSKGVIRWIKRNLAEHNLTLGMDVSARINEIRETCNRIEEIITPKCLVEYMISTIIGGAIGNAKATSLTLCLMENIAEGGDCDALMRKEDDNGNDLLMRIAPVVALLNIDNEKFSSRLENVEKYSAITQAHLRSVLGCIIYTEFLWMLYLTNDKDLALDGIRNICSHIKFNIAKYQDELSHYKRMLSYDFKEMKRDDIQSDGYVMHPLEAALWCFLKNDNFKDTVLEAANLGGDTDTTAMLAGSMAGLYYGLESIPEEWSNSLAKYDYIKRLCRRFEAKLKRGTFTDQRDGKTYKTVKIDDMIWLAENFNYEGEDKYDFETAKKICPLGWHLPSDEEWGRLLYYVSYNSGSKLDFLDDAGRYLKAKEGWEDGEDTFGFAALPNGSFWWSDTKCENDEEFVWTCFIKHDSDEVQICNTWVGDKLFLRYVKDE